jgi:hypothetical protein
LANSSELRARPASTSPDELCDELLVRLSAHPEDDICLLAVTVPEGK